MVKRFICQIGGSLEVCVCVGGGGGTVNPIYQYKTISVIDSLQILY